MTLLEQDAPEGLEGRSVPGLETARLVLRPPRFEDAGTIAVLVNDRRIAENTRRIPPPYALADAQAFLTTANASGGEIVFLITTWDGAVLGCCGIGKLDGDHPHSGYWLVVLFWGKGYATGAASAVIDHAFGDLGYDVLVSGARVSNPPSRRVLQ